MKTFVVIGLGRFGTALARELSALDHEVIAIDRDAARVHAIAEKLGYNDVAHFSKTFKRIVGKTPGEYRATLDAERLHGGS